MTGDDTALSLRGWAAEAEAAAGIAKALAPTAFVPESLRRYTDQTKKQLDYDGTVQTVAAVLLAGQELGFGPMASLRSFVIIKGTVALYALAARGLLQQHGHDIVVKESTSERAIVDGRRAGGSWQRVTWDLTRAKTAGLYPGHQDGNWRRNPKAMLVARATAETARWIAADALLGLPALVEELDDEGQEVPAIDSAQTEPPPDANGTKAKTTRRRAVPSRVELPAATPLPPPEPPPAPVPEDPPPRTQPRLTPTARTAIHAKLGGLGITAREEGLALLAAWIGHPLESTNELTPHEASVVLDRMDALLNIGARAEDQHDDDGPPDAEPD